MTAKNAPRFVNAYVARKKTTPLAPSCVSPSVGRGDRGERRRGSCPPARSSCSRAGGGCSSGAAPSRCRRSSRPRRARRTGSSSRRRRTCCGPKPSKKMRMHDGERRRLAADGEERGDRRRRALVDVGHPHLERHDRHLEAEARGEEDHADDERRARCRCRRDAIVLAMLGEPSVLTSCVVPEMPKRNAMPYRITADETAPSSRYFSAGLAAAGRRAGSRRGCTARCSSAPARRRS